MSPIYRPPVRNQRVLRTLPKRIYLFFKLKQLIISFFKFTYHFSNPSLGFSVVNTFLNEEHNVQSGNQCGDCRYSEHDVCRRELVNVAACH